MGTQQDITYTQSKSTLRAELVSLVVLDDHFTLSMKSHLLYKDMKRQISTAVKFIKGVCLIHEKHFHGFSVPLNMQILN